MSLLLSPRLLPAGGSAATLVLGIVGGAFLLFHSSSCEGAQCPELGTYTQEAIAQKGLDAYIREQNQLLTDREAELRQATQPAEIERLSRTIDYLKTFIDILECWRSQSAATTASRPAVAATPPRSHRTFTVTPPAMVFSELQRRQTVLINVEGDAIPHVQFDGSARSVLGKVIAQTAMRKTGPGSFELTITAVENPPLPFDEVVPLTTTTDNSTVLGEIALRGRRGVEDRPIVHSLIPY